MSKPVIVVTIVICSLLLCSFTYLAWGSAAGAMRSAQSESGAQPQKIAAAQPRPEERIAEASVPLSAAETAAQAGPAGEGRIVPYSMAWLDRYAPASVAPFEEQVGDNGDYETIMDRPHPTTYKLVVDYYNQCVYAFSRDERGNYINLERVMICTTGGNGDWTPEGTYGMGGDYHRFGYFTSFDCYAQYWSQIFGSFYFHSTLYSARDASTYTMSSYDNLGTPGSHGCIRLLAPDARWIYENCAPDTICVVMTEYEENEALKTALKKGYEGAVDYAPPAETEEEAA